MSGDSEKLNKKWGLIKEQLIALCTLNKLPKGNDEFTRLLCEDIELRSLNSQYLTSICYFILGLINSEERDKLIQWPLINIKTHTKFRKGMSAMVTNFQEKYPFSHIKKLPESYFMNPHGYQSRILDFLSRLTNLAIHVTLNDSELLLMHSGEGLNSKEIGVMTEIISRARKREENLIESTVLPLKKIEDAKNEVCDTCIALRQENDDLQQQIDNLKRHAVTEQFVSSEKNASISDLKIIRDKKLSELINVNKELSKYYEPSKELLSKLKAFKNPLSLSAEDFNCENSSPDLLKATSRVCGDLCQFFQYITSNNSSKDELDKFYEQLKTLKESMREQNETLNSFLCNTSAK